MKIATVSFNSIWEDKKNNLIEFERIVNSLKNKAEFVIFPEMTLKKCPVWAIKLLSKAQDF